MLFLPAGEVARLSEPSDSIMDEAVIVCYLQMCQLCIHVRKVGPWARWKGRIGKMPGTITEHVNAGGHIYDCICVQPSALMLEMHRHL